jgi:hypothetical protein
MKKPLGKMLATLALACSALLARADSAADWMALAAAGRG